LAGLLLVASLSALAQSDLIERSGKDDIAATVKQLSSETAQIEASQQAAVPQDGLPIQQVLRIIPFGRVARGTNNQSSGITSLAPTGAHLTYWGGAVISNIQVFVVFWGPNVSPAITANGTIDQFYTDITSSRYFDALTEYTTAGIVGSNGTSTTNQTIGHGTFGNKFTITPSICPGTAACTVTDAQIQTELTNQISANALPGPSTDAHGVVSTYYAIYFPPNVTISLPNGTGGVVNSCVKGGFCAYHSTTSSNLPYGVMPDFSSGGCAVGCGVGTTLQIATNVSSHEMAEAITDAEVGVANVFGPPLGWYDNPPNLGEIADLCDPAEATVTAGSHTYTVEPLFSNLQNDCVTAPPVMQMPASGAGPGVQFSLPLTLQSSTTGATLSAYKGTVHFTSSDPAAVLPSDYTYVAGDAGSHTFQFTLNTLGDQTISVVDTHAGGFTGTTNVTVSTATDLADSISLSQATALQGATGLTFATSVRNNGGSASTGAVTVTATLGSGLNATAIGGTGWSCTLAALTCTRTDALASAASYPDVTVTFNVAASAPSTASISSTVSGGGDADLANNTATATVSIGPVVSITSSTASAIVTAGGSAQYTMALTLGPTAGTVNFSCSGLPTASTCAFSPTSLTSSGSVNMVVTTTARGAAMPDLRPGNRNPWLLLGLLSLAAMAAFILQLRTQPRARKLAPIFAVCALLLACVLAGCGGGSTPHITNPVVGTPPGTYTLTFTATSANGTASKTMTLTVN
jgi:hypothetical protein